MKNIISQKEGNKNSVFRVPRKKMKQISQTSRKVPDLKQHEKVPYKIKCINNSMTGERGFSGSRANLKLRGKGKKRRRKKSL